MVTPQPHHPSLRVRGTCGHPFARAHYSMAVWPLDPPEDTATTSLDQVQGGSCERSRCSAACCPSRAAPVQVVADHGSGGSRIRAHCRMRMWPYSAQIASAVGRGQAVLKTPPHTVEVTARRRVLSRQPVPRAAAIAQMAQQRQVTAARRTRTGTGRESWRRPARGPVRVNKPLHRRSVAAAGSKHQRCASTALLCSVL
jgi:hypothetical protein